MAGVQGFSRVPAAEILVGSGQPLSELQAFPKHVRTTCFGP